jgi:hypothetical protein
MRKKHRPQTPNINRDIRNGSTSANGMMHNQVADNRLTATINKNEVRKTSVWPFGGNYDKNVIVHSVKDFVTGQVLYYILDDGSIVYASELQKAGRTASGFNQQMKKVFRDIDKECGYVRID